MRTYTSALILQFLMGIWIAEGARGGRGMSPPLSALSIVGGVVALFVIPVEAGAAVSVACGVASAAIVWGVVSMDLRHSVPEVRIALLSGDASYSIYLWHGIALTISAKLADMLGLSGWITISLSVAAGIAGGIIAYLLVEQPIRNLMSRRKMPRAPAT